MWPNKVTKLKSNLKSPPKKKRDTVRKFGKILKCFRSVLSPFLPILKVYVNVFLNLKIASNAACFQIMTVSAFVN